MIIGLHGRLQSGKDTVYSYLKDWGEANGRPVTREAFADRLKISAAHALGILDNEIETMNLLKEGGEVVVKVPNPRHGFSDYHMITGREYLQYYGTEAHRDVFDPDFWVNAVLPPPPLDFDGYDLCITDVRFPNEAERIHEYADGEVWHIVRADQEENDLHASEQVLPPRMVDQRVYNDGTLADLRLTVENIADRRLRIGEKTGV